MSSIYCYNTQTLDSIQFKMRSETTCTSGKPCQIFRNNQFGLGYQRVVLTTWISEIKGCKKQNGLKNIDTGRDSSLVTKSDITSCKFALWRSLKVQVKLWKRWINPNENLTQRKFINHVCQNHYRKGFHEYVYMQKQPGCTTCMWKWNSADANACLIINYPVFVSANWFDAF